MKKALFSDETDEALTAAVNKSVNTTHQLQSPDGRMLLLQAMAKTTRGGELRAPAASHNLRPADFH